MAFTPVTGLNPQYDEQDTWWLKFYKPETTTPIEMATSATGETQLAKAQLDVDGFITTDGTQLFIPFVDQSYDAYLFPTEAEADANDTINAKRIAENINPFGLGFEQEVNYYPFTITEGQTSLTVPDAPNGLILVKDGDTQEQGESGGDVKDFVYDVSNGNIQLTVALTGNEQVFVIYGAIVAISGIGVTGAKEFDSLSIAKTNPDLVAGDIFNTLGYHSLNDGGSAKYKVIEIGSSVYSQLDFVFLDETGLYAQLIPEKDEISLAQAGAKFLDEGAEGFDDQAIDEALLYCGDNGLTLHIDGKKSYYYRTHQVTNSSGTGEMGFVIKGSGRKSELNSRGDIIILEFLASHAYKNMHLKDFNLQSSGTRNDTGIKIRRWFESCSMNGIYQIAFRYGFHILNSFNPSFYNCEARQAASKYNDGTDTDESYGWWIDQSEGAINALYFHGCAAQLFWNNWFIDNSTQSGNFVSLDFFGIRNENAFETGIRIEGNGGQMNFYGGYHENNWRRAQLLENGQGVAADQGINISVRGTTGTNDYNINLDGGYFQISQNIRNNTPMGEIMNIFAGRDLEELNFTAKNLRMGYNVPSVVDWNIFLDDSINTLNTDISVINSGKDSLSNVYLGNRYKKRELFDMFGVDNSTDLTSEPLFSFATSNSVVFVVVTPDATASFTTPPTYRITNQQGTTLADVVLPSSVTALEPIEYRLNLGQTGVVRFSRAAIAGGANPNFNFEFFQKEVGFNTLVTYEDA